MIEYKESTGVLVFNDNNELALQLRASGDDTYPSYWDFSSGGGIDKGEDAKDSAIRELQEELGITAEVKYVSTEHLTYPAWKPSTTRKEDIHIYKANHNGPFEHDPHEVDKVEFFSLDKIQNMIDLGEKVHPGFILVWEWGVITNALKN